MGPWSLRAVMWLCVALAQAYWWRMTAVWWARHACRTASGWQRGRDWCRLRRSVKAELCRVYARGVARGMGGQAAGEPEHGATEDARAWSVWLAWLSLSSGWYGRLLSWVYG
ncbi:hypothetical protein [Burkholderia sp. MSMB175]|nr:hypothetical protein [Burkholderia sp. MSMB175]AOK29052.1 hypothetical protein AQ611_06045 [Burkholderia sp. Bp7605]